MAKGLEIFLDYHTHTLYSHGKGSIEDNIRSAIDKGLKGIAITDHGPAHFFIGVKKNRLREIKEEILRLREKYPQFKILFGIEANIISIDGQIDVPENILKEMDIVLAGIHPIVRTATWRDAYYIAFLNKLRGWFHFRLDELREINTRALIKAMERYPIDIISHPGHSVDIDTKELAKAAAYKGVALEINCNHKNMDPDFIKIALEEGATFSLGSDAHKPEEIGNFDHGLELIEKCGIPPKRIINALNLY
jgi:putative hydrolase